MISVVIILKNDLGIIETIAGLNQQDFTDKFEIIVVDRSTIKYPKIGSKVPLHWIKFDPGHKRFTIPDQRNVGVRAATGNIIVFLDANCLPEPNWLSHMVAPILTSDENIVSGMTLSRHKSTLNDVSQLRIKNKDYLLEAGTNNMAFTREVFDKVGGFDESLEYGSDVEFTWRAIQAGYMIKTQPLAISYHDWGDQKEEFRRTILYGKARARIIIKHLKTHWLDLFGKSSTVLLYPFLILTSPLVFIYPAYALLFVILIIKNINEPNPVGVVVKNTVYGLGVLLEIKDQILSRLT